MHPSAAGQTWASRSTDIQRPARSWTSAVRRAARHGLLTAAGRFARFGTRGFVRCLYAHWVLDDQTGAFRDLLRRLQEVGEFVCTARLLRLLHGESPLEGRFFHLSFDDGFDNLYRNALPVLSELEIPATLFVPSAFIGADDSDVLERWWPKFPYPAPMRPLRWDWLSEMSKLGHDIGSHTRRHVRLSDVSRDAVTLRDELAGSKEEIEQNLGEPCRYFSWPWGGPADIDERVQEAIHEAGYEASFAAKRGPLEPGRTSDFAIPRHHFEPDWPWPHVRFFAAGGLERR